MNEDIAGQVFVFFILTVAAAEAAIGLAILVVLFRNRETINVADIDTMRVVDKHGQRTALKNALDQLIAGLPKLSDIVSRRYFSLTEEQPQRVHTRLAP